MIKDMNINIVTVTLHQVALQINEAINKNECNPQLMDSILKELEMLIQKNYISNLTARMSDNNWLNEFDINHQALVRLCSQRIFDKKNLFELSQKFLNLSNQLEKLVNVK